MQTFLPSSENFYKSLSCLDNLRLNKQITEAFQILRALGDEEAWEFDTIDEAGKRKLVSTFEFETWKARKFKARRWQIHPAVKMWRGYEDALKVYHNIAWWVWVTERGNSYLNRTFKTNPNFVYPHWFGDEWVHASHRSNLLRKKPEWYSQFGWSESPNLEYVWP